MITTLLLTTMLASHRRAVAPPPLFPSCTSVTGSPAVTFSRDGGRTTVPVEQKLSGIAYTFGVAVLGADTLLSAHNFSVAVSNDSGCTWRNLGDVVLPDPFPMTITPATNGLAYLWSDHRANFVRYQSERTTVLTAPAEVAGIGVDLATPDRVRLGSVDGVIWESTDGGYTWSRLSQTPLTNPFAYRVAFDRTNLDHAVFGMLGEGALVTFDGGRSFVVPSGLGHGFNVFSVAISPVDPNTVWAEGLEVRGETRRIFLSRDGGRSFTPVISQSPDVVLVNGTLIVPHPSDPNVLFFVFGSYFQNYGTDLYRYDAAAAVLTKTHFPFDDIDAIVFSPRNPDVMYFGLEVVEGVFSDPI